MKQTEQTEPKNIHIALVKKEEILKDKNKRVIVETNEWREIKDYKYLLIAINHTIFRIEEIQFERTLKKKEGLKIGKYWEIDYSGTVGLARGRGRRVYQLKQYTYDQLRTARIAYLSMLDEFENWGLIKKKKKQEDA